MISQKPLARSCDSCRQHKGDGSNMPGQRCGRCMTAGQSCTYLQPVSKPGPKNKLVQELREKVAALEAKLRDLSVCAICSQSLSTCESGSTPASQKNIPEAEEVDVDTLAGQFQEWKISTGFISCKPQFFGPASNVNLLQNLLVLKARHPERSLKAPSSPHRRSIYRNQFPVACLSFVSHRRPDILLLQWEKEHYSPPPRYVFPPSNVLTTLVDFYFENVHPTFPVLHRNSFVRRLAEGLHQMDSRFGAVVLAVLALGSQYSDDPQVMLDGNTLSSGWPFVSQLQTVLDPSECTVYHLQFYCLMTLYSMGASTRPMVWLYLGLGIACVRYHGRYPRTMKSEEELWNRGFWSIFVLDGLMSSFLGRAPAIDLDEYDVEPPLEVDDEFWDHGFVQPLGRPSALSFFVRFVRLFKILGKTLRRLYAPKELKSRMKWTPELQQKTVVELDSMMNAFMDSLPPHLCWDPVHGQGVFFDQSAVLHATFYWLQIAIHRPYMLTRTAHPDPSLFICLSAARSALSVADTWISRSQRVASSFIQNSTFISAVIIILKDFVNPRGVDSDKDQAHVQTAARIFKSCESRSQSAGILWEVLQDITEYKAESRDGVENSDMDAWALPADPLDNELLSLWLSAPVVDLMNVDWKWDPYVENMASNAL
ncbi:fungal-specific transcription factor domain-containing protein [Roridomyces roridus]|uniref:Fungal-specific transcription factor domain-containing protein n=1 Tax=Roridomyces roridus TaxID=1738132 RepID=A0AAD7CMY9_9AGAR|nr:fungal-specific transcription factor domain-containing protein [Roridomyces roridus]